MLAVPIITRTDGKSVDSLDAFLRSDSGSRPNVAHFSQPIPIKSSQSRALQPNKTICSKLLEGAVNVHRRDAALPISACVIGSSQAPVRQLSALPRGLTNGPECLSRPSPAGRCAQCLV